MDDLSSRPTSKEGNTALQYEGFVLDFNERAYVFSKCHAINRLRQLLEKSSETNTNGSMDVCGSKPNYKVGNTAIQTERFVLGFEKRAYVLNLCRAVNHPLKPDPKTDIIQEACRSDIRS
uniref:BEN domain-containing protein n=1 Tax=Panagrellus redivivus TaxID=6233 RepID=A0A7E4UUV0_PANRE